MLVEVGNHVLHEYRLAGTTVGRKEVAIGQDILDCLPLAVKMDREGLDEEMKGTYYAERIV